ncbi:hypothetical protein K1719_034803 [Acacia pycnantha]|nr:hypothetical protein K1719_034803 [Acacia pycnantha]
MVVAAFKSSSRRGNLTSPSVTVSAREFREEAHKKAPIQRSRSVSARTSSDVCNYLVKRDNPLFCTQTESMEMEGTPKVYKTTATTLDPVGVKSTNSNSGFGWGGKSVTRDNAVSCKETDQSLSRLDTSCGNRSASQVPGEAEQDCSITISKDGNNLDLLGSNRKGGSPRSNNGVLALEIRREYSKILGESQERARKLRPDLAVEERRTQELESILKEVLPYPKNPNVLKSCPRKASIERRMMSKRLAEDAMAYFDEFVSLFPFDSSDFSSQDDPPHNLFGSSMPSDSHLPEARPIEGPEPHHARVQCKIILLL